MTAFRGELYNIMPIENIPTVLEYGILSHNEMNRLKIKNISVADPNVQKRREGTIPNGMPVHHYANLYFDARNPMMYKLKSNNRQEQICVLVIHQKVLKKDNVVLSDRNVAAGDDWIRYFSPEDIEGLHFEKIYAKYWKPQGHNNDCPCGECQNNKSIKCAEVLVPQSVDSSFILKAHVVNAKAKQQLQEKGFSESKISITPDLFFC